MIDNTNGETKSSTKAKSKYNKKAYSRTHISFKHSEMAILNMHCEKYGYSKNGFVVQAVKEKIERDTGKSFDEFIKENQPEQEQHQEQDQKNADND